MIGSIGSGVLGVNFAQKPQIIEIDLQSAIGAGNQNSQSVTQADNANLSGTSGSLVQAFQSDGEIFSVLFGEDTFAINSGEEIGSEVTGLSEADENRIDEILDEIDSISGYGDLELSEEQLKREADIFAAINAIVDKTDPQPVSASDETKYNQILTELNKISEQNELTQSDERRIEALEQQLFELDEKYTPSAPTAEDEQKLDALYEELDEVYGIEPLTAEVENRINDLYAELDQIFEDAFDA